MLWPFITDLMRPRIGGANGSYKPIDMLSDNNAYNVFEPHYGPPVITPNPRGNPGYGIPFANAPGPQGAYFGQFQFPVGPINVQGLTTNNVSVRGHLATSPDSNPTGEIF